MEDFDDQPSTRLSSAFIVVLILHVVAVGGIYAFNSIKSQRKSRELGVETVATPAPESPAASGAQKLLPVANSIEGVPVAPTPPTIQSNLVSPVSGSRVHKVQSGETLSQVSSLYSVSAVDLAKANGIEAGAKLRLGQALNIPIARTGANKPTLAETKKPAIATKGSVPVEKSASAAAAKTTYVVAKGDNPVSIARRLGVSYEALLKLNKISDPKRLQLGQELQIPPKKSL